MFLKIIIALLVVAGGFFLKQKLFKKKKVGTKKRLDGIVLSGPSGVGKGTLINMLLRDFPSNFGFSVSHTSRAPREGEVNGKDYHFVSRDAMQKMIDNGEFLESCDVHGNLYGTSKAALKAVRDSGKTGIIEIDVQGAQKLKKQQGDLNLYYMFITAPSLKELEERIVKRGKETPDKIAVRLETARKELDFIEKNPDFYDKVLKNDDLDSTYTRLKSILKTYGGL